MGGVQTWFPDYRSSRVDRAIRTLSRSAQESFGIFQFFRGSRPGQVLRCTSKSQKSTDLQGWSERSVPFQDQLRNPSEFFNFFGDPGLGKYSDALLGLRSPQIFKGGQSDLYPFKINSGILRKFSTFSGIQAWASTHMYF